MTVVKKTLGGEPWRDPALGPCACSQLRRTSRAVSTLYDEFLSSSGLTVTQYALLASIGRAERISRTALAAKLGMERTTLTRNLRPLEREGLVGEKPGSDRRERVLQLTASGQKRLDRSFPLWEAAQRAFFAEFGQDRFEELRFLLMNAAEASNAVGKAARARMGSTKGG
jgi:DNA-binding MarR family transcriptional regulator